MTSQAIEGTGMTLRMSGGWTSDIVEMQLPYVVRQAIDDTHLGDTIIRWVPSKDIEYGTMAIRFWHDPDNILPITGQPETMVITYPDGVHHLAVIGYVEKIGKESIKVGELMQTDAMVRILHYPKMPSAFNGSFPALSGALIGKVITDIMETATLRYLVDTTTTSPCEPVKATIPGASADLPKFGTYAIETLPSVVFGKKGFCSPSGSSASGQNTATVLPNVPINDLTVAVVISYGPYVGSISSYTNRASMGLGETQGVDITGVAFSHFNHLAQDHYTLLLKNTVIYNSLTDGDGAGAANKSRIAVFRRKSGTTTLYINNLSKSCSQVTGSFTPRIMNANFTSIDIGGRGRFYVRDYAFWDTAISDSDFSSLNEQLCTEYGI